MQSWEEFEMAFSTRFEDEDLEDTVEEMMRLRQEEGVADYEDQFEELRIRMEWLLVDLREAYFLSTFIGGLKDEIRFMVRMLKPTTLTQAVKIARL